MMGHVIWHLDILTKPPYSYLNKSPFGGTADGQSRSEELVPFKLEGKVTGLGTP